MTLRTGTIIAIFLAGLSGLAGCSGSEGTAGSGQGGAAETGAGGEEIAEDVPPGMRDVLIVFASGADDLLHAERRQIYWTASVEDRAKQALTELIAGPQKGLLPVLPKNTYVRELYILPNGIAWVDFSDEILRMNGGTTAERAMVYAIVGTLALNFPEVRRVGILVDGDEVESLAGHIDLRRPFTPDPSILTPALARILRQKTATRGA